MFDTDYVIKVILILYTNLNICFKEIMRANDPSLIHPWHPKFCDSALGHHQLDSCQRTRASHLGSIDWLYEKWRNPRWPRKKISRSNNFTVTSRNTWWPGMTSRDLCWYKRGEMSAMSNTAAIRRIIFKFILLLLLF